MFKIIYTQLNYNRVMVQTFIHRLMPRKEPVRAQVNSCGVYMYLQKCHCDIFSSEYLRFPLSVLPSNAPYKCIYHQGYSISGN